METHKDKLYTEIFFFSYIRLLKHIKYETVYSNTALENICAYISRIHTKTIEWLYRWNCTLRTVTENNLFFFLFFKILLIQHSRIYMWDKEKIGHVSLLLKLCQRLREKQTKNRNTGTFDCLGHSSHWSVTCHRY